MSCAYVWPEWKENDGRVVQGEVLWARNVFDYTAHFAVCQEEAAPLEAQNPGREDIQIKNISSGTIVMRDVVYEQRRTRAYEHPPDADIQFVGKVFLFRLPRAPMQYIFWELQYIQFMVVGNLERNWISRSWPQWEAVLARAGFGAGHLQRGWVGQRRQLRLAGQQVPGHYTVTLTKDILILRLGYVCVRMAMRTQT